MAQTIFSSSTLSSSSFFHRSHTPNLSLRTSSITYPFSSPINRTTTSIAAAAANIAVRPIVAPPIESVTQVGQLIIFSLFCN
jgi:hypothetical protein